MSSMVIPALKLGQGRRFDCFLGVIEHEPFTKIEVLLFVVHHAEINCIGDNTALIDSDNLLQEIHKAVPIGGAGRNPCIRCWGHFALSQGESGVEAELKFAHILNCRKDTRSVQPDVLAL